VTYIRDVFSLQLGTDLLQYPESVTSPARRGRYRCGRAPTRAGRTADRDRLLAGTALGIIGGWRHGGWGWTRVQADVPCRRFRNSLLALVADRVVAEARYLSVCSRPEGLTTAELDPALETRRSSEARIYHSLTARADDS